MMREKAAEKSIDPMFPRLKVSDAEQHGGGGGPRAPPRNKMALYEQLGTPATPRLRIGLSDVVSLSAPSDSTLVASMPSTHSGDHHQRNMLVSFRNSSAQSSYLSDKSLLYSSCGIQLNTTATSKDWKFMKPTSFQSLVTTRSPLSTYNFSELKDFDIDNNNKPISCETTNGGNDWESFPQLSLNSSMHLEKQMKGTKSFDLKLFSKQPHSSLNDLKKSSVVNTLNYLASERAKDENVLKDSFFISIRKENAFSQCNNNLTAVGIDNDCYEDKSCTLVNSRRHGDISESTWVDSRPVSTGVLVGVLGEKQFWKARNTIANQQRIFTLQVFELHRLIKVQKMIAGSPRLFLKDNLLLEKTALHGFLMKKFPSEYIGELLPSAVKLKDQKSNENTVQKIILSPPPLVNKEISMQPPNYDPKPSPWCIMPSRNQWLVPVMSPSEVLIFKPYAVPCPPPTASSVYGSSYQNPTPSASGDFLSSSYCVPPSHKTGIIPTWGQTCSPLYNVSNSDQSSIFSGTRSKDSQFLVGDVDFTRPIHSFGNRSSQMSKTTASGFFRQFQKNEVLGNATTTNLSCQRDELQLFPTEPTVQASSQNNDTTSKQSSAQVIKAVPHNPMSASESTAQIFRSIQEQRKKL